MSNISAYTRCYICMSANWGEKFRHNRKEHGKCCLLFRFLFQTVCRRCHIHTRSFPALPYRSPTKEHRDRYTDKGTLYLHCYCSIFYNSVKIACVFLYPEIFADISRRAIKPRLYNTKEKKRLSDILFGGSLFSAVIKIMYRTFPIRASADRENTALLPTERIRQKQRCRKRFSAACGIKSFNSLS